MTKTKKTFPTRVRFFIADDIRSDGPKPMLIGFLPDDIVGLDLPVEHPEPSKDAPIILQSLAILVSFIGCNGNFEAETSLYQPDGTALFENQKLDGGISSEMAAEKANINFIAKFMPFAIPQFGQYKLIFKLDDKGYEYSFTVMRASLSK